MRTTIETREKVREEYTTTSTTTTATIWKRREGDTTRQTRVPKLK